MKPKTKFWISVIFAVISLIYAVGSTGEGRQAGLLFAGGFALAAINQVRIRRNEMKDEPDQIDSLEVSGVEGRIETTPEKVSKRREELAKEHKDKIEFLARKGLEKNLGPPLYDNYTFSELDQDGQISFAIWELEDEFKSDTIKNVEDFNLRQAMSSAAKESITGTPDTPDFLKTLKFIKSSKTPYEVEILNWNRDFPFDVPTSIEVDQEKLEGMTEDVRIKFDATLEGTEEECHVSDIENIKIQ